MGITSHSTISNVSFQFGTNSSAGFLAAIAAPNSAAVPEPGAIALPVGVAVTGILIAFARRRSK
jgi:hypothetical protein